MVETTTRAPIEISATDNDRMQQFISRYGEYVEGKVYILQPGSQRAINAKPNVVGDLDKTKQLQAVVKEFGGVLSMFPSPPKFLFPAISSALQGYKMMLLHEEDIEDGGPQPRLHILDDPARLAKVNAIADSIEIEGQREPIDAYPSPSGNGKYRVCEGRMRHTAIFKVLKPQGRKGPDGKVIDYIIAKVKNRTELEAWEDAWILQDKETLTAYEQGAYIENLTKKFPEIYVANRHGFNYQETIAKRLGLTVGRVCQIIGAHRDADAIAAQLPEEKINPVKNLPERVFRETRRAPDEVKPAIIEATIDHKLNTTEVKKLVEVTKASPEMTKEEIAAVAERIKQEKALPKPEPKTEEEIAAERVAQINRADEKYERKLERSIDKAVEAGSHFPEDLMVAVHGHLGKSTKDGKVDAEKAEAYAMKVVTIMFERTSEEDLERIFAEADRY